MSLFKLDQNKISPFEIFEKNGIDEFIKRFLTYSNAGNQANIDDSWLKKNSSLNLIRQLLSNTFVLSVESSGRSKPGYLLLNNNFELVLVEKDSLENHFITLFDEKIVFEDLDKPLINQKTNFLEVFLKGYEQYLIRSITNKIHSRYSFCKKNEFLNDLSKIKWVNHSNDITWAINEVEKSVGITEKEYLLQDGSKAIGLAPIKRMIYGSFESHKAEQNWDIFTDEKNLFIQGGDDGVVFSSEGNYTTAFVEVFPNNLKDGNKTFGSFIRGEGKTFAEAEKQAFDLVVKAKNCKNHIWDKKGRTDGVGFCSLCGVFNSKAFK